MHWSITAATQVAAVALVLSINKVNHINKANNIHKANHTNQVHDINDTYQSTIEQTHYYNTWIKYFNQHWTTPVYCYSNTVEVKAISIKEKQLKAKRAPTVRRLRASAACNAVAGFTVFHSIQTKLLALQPLIQQCELDWFCVTQPFWDRNWTVWAIPKQPAHLQLSAFVLSKN